MFDPAHSQESAGSWTRRKVRAVSSSEHFAQENICKTEIFLRFRCLAPAVATQEATDGDMVTATASQRNRCRYPYAGRACQRRAPFPHKAGQVAEKRGFSALLLGAGVCSRSRQRVPQFHCENALIKNPAPPDQERPSCISRRPFWHEMCLIGRVLSASCRP